MFGLVRDSFYKNDTIVNVKIVELDHSFDLKRFVRFQRHLYNGNSFYTPPLDAAEFSKFSLDNPMAKGCEFKLWLAFSNNEILGRICGIINHNFNTDKKIKQARFTHFDCIRHEAVAHELLSTAQEWAIEKGMSELIGPFGFTNLDKHGLLVYGFEELACQSSNYNYSYYQEYVESFGFSKVHDWVEHRITIPRERPAKFAALASVVQKRHKLQVLSVNTSKALSDIAPKVFELYNKCYSKLYGVSPLSEIQVNSLIKDFIPHVNPKFVSIIADAEGSIVGFGITMPSLSQSLQKAKGRLLPFGFLHLMNTARNNHVLDLLLIGIHPDFQRKGVPALIFNELATILYSNKIKYLETTQNLEDNHSILNLWSKFEHRLHKRSRLYKKSLQ